MRREIEIDSARYVVLRRMGKRLLLEELRGDFSDYRKRLGFTQAQMSERLQISQAALSKMENGELVPRPELLKRCEKLLSSKR